MRAYLASSSIQLAEDGGPVAGFCEHGDEPLGSIKKARCFLTR
jgi:hypothetical protein